MIAAQGMGKTIWHDFIVKQWEAKLGPHPANQAP